MDLREIPGYLEDNYKNSNDYMKDKFKQKYHFIPFQFLVSLNKCSRTDDGCLRFKNPVSGTIYTWNSLKQEWK